MISASASAKRESPQRRSADVDIAVLQVQYANIEEKVSDIKVSLRELSDQVTSTSDKTSREIGTLAAKIDRSHTDVNTKLAALEKWKWMLMGGGLAVGSIGWQLVEHWDSLIVLIK